MNADSYFKVDFYILPKDGEIDLKGLVNFTNSVTNMGLVLKILAKEWHPKNHKMAGILRIRVYVSNDQVSNSAKIENEVIAQGNRFNLEIINSGQMRKRFPFATDKPV